MESAVVPALPDDNDELRVLVNTVLLPGGGSCRAWRRRGIVPVPKPHQLFTPSAIDTGGGTYMRPPRADETDMEPAFFGLVCLAFFAPLFFLSVLFVLSVCVCVVLSVLLFVFVCLRSRCVLRFFGPFLSVLSCLSCFFYDLMSCAVSCVFFWFVCSSSLCYRYWWHGDGTDMRCHVQMEQTYGRHSCWSRQWLLAGYAGACLLAYWPCLLVMLVLGCWLCFLITLLLAC